ncbi:unnamed protein product [Symbiodinium necroappetens]|uniref:ShKT domain-containing protein n=1 Tax=Symbiodinium necroappetens TaxID=1628268 RepID=A0A812R0R4_9DINO|nr:unnamed protein product [Symbiodinium necroappetens]
MHQDLCMICYSTISEADGASLEPCKRAALESSSAPENDEACPQVHRVCLSKHLIIQAEDGKFPCTCPFCLRPLSLREIHRSLSPRACRAWLRLHNLWRELRELPRQEQDHTNTLEVEEVRMMQDFGCRRCPRCGVWIEKQEPGWLTGCDKMTCRCGGRFCFRCGSVEAQCSCSLGHDFIEQESVAADYADLHLPWPISELFREGTKVTTAAESGATSDEASASSTGVGSNEVHSVAGAGEPKQLLPNLSSGDVRQLGRVWNPSRRLVHKQAMTSLEVFWRPPLTSSSQFRKEDRHLAFGLVSPDAQNPAARPISQRAGSSARLFKVRSSWKLRLAGPSSFRLTFGRARQALPRAVLRSSARPPGHVDGDVKDWFEVRCRPGKVAVTATVEVLSPPSSEGSGQRSLAATPLEPLPAAGPLNTCLRHVLGWTAGPADAKRHRDAFATRSEELPPLANQQFDVSPVESDASWGPSRVEQAASKRHLVNTRLHQAAGMMQSLKARGMQVFAMSAVSGTDSINTPMIACVNAFGVVRQKKWNGTSIIEALKFKLKEYEARYGVFDENKNRHGDKELAILQKVVEDGEVAESLQPSERATLHMLQHGLRDYIDFALDESLFDTGSASCGRRMRVVALFVLRVGLALAVDSLDSTEASEVRRALNLDETCQDEDGRCSTSLLQVAGKNVVNETTGDERGCRTCETSCFDLRRDRLECTDPWKQYGLHCDLPHIAKLCPKTCGCCRSCSLGRHARVVSTVTDEEEFAWSRQGDPTYNPCLKCSIVENAVGDDMDRTSPPKMFFDQLTRVAEFGEDAWWFISPAPGGRAFSEAERRSLFEHGPQDQEVPVATQQPWYDPSAPSERLHHASVLVFRNRRTHGNCFFLACFSGVARSPALQV